MSEHSFTQSYIDHIDMLVGQIDRATIVVEQLLEENSRLDAELVKYREALRMVEVVEELLGKGFSFALEYEQGTRWWAAFYLDKGGDYFTWVAKGPAEAIARAAREALEASHE